MDIANIVDKAGAKSKYKAKKPKEIEAHNQTGMSKNIYLTPKSLDKRDEIINSKGSFSSYINELIEKDLK